MWENKLQIANNIYLYIINRECFWFFWKDYSEITIDVSADAHF